ncbi:beta-carotene ketolase [Sphingomonas sp. ID1715]|nr:beta-carotene ketolase [Sphingomonas sp. ID1715]
MKSVVASAEQRWVGLLLAGAIVAAWLTVHIICIFFWNLEPRTAPAVLAIILLQAWLSTGLFIIAHDAMHGALAPGRPRVNRWMGTLCLALYAALSYRQLAPSHARHHRHAGTADDPDFHAAEPTRAGPWFLAFFRSYYTHGQILRITLVAIVYMLLRASLSNIVMFWAMPALLALWQLFFFGTYLPHRHEAAGFADHHRARSTQLSPMMSLITCFHFGGYHHEHHLSPATPWWALPRLTRR